MTSEQPPLQRRGIDSAPPRELATCSIASPLLPVVSLGPGDPCFRIYLGSISFLYTFLVLLFSVSLIYMSLFLGVFGCLVFFARLIIKKIKGACLITSCSRAFASLRSDEEDDDEEEEEVVRSVSVAAGLWPHYSLRGF